MLNLDSIINYRLDAIGFIALLLVVTFITHRWLAKKHERGLPLMAWALIGMIGVMGFVASEIAGERERFRMRGILSGIAPTYASEMQVLGHDQINLETKSDDQTYLKLIEAEIRWEKVNVNVSDIYTYVKRPDGKIAMLVDSETDYNHSGSYDEDREQRTDIGEEYPEPTEGMIEALTGQSSFDGVPYSDRWGTWISAFEPILDASGNVIAALGVDYNARDWQSAIVRNRLAAIGLTFIFAVVSLASTIIVLITRAELANRKRLESERSALQEQLIHASRQAGMAEIATGVLHNVGNVLNSVNVSARVVSEGLRTSRIGSLGKLATLINTEKSHLGEFVTNDPRGKCLPEFLDQLHTKMKSDQDNIQKELEQLMMGVDHIKEVVRMQQNCATFSKNVLLPVSPVSIMEDAYKVNLISMERHKIEVHREFDENLPLLALDKHKILQILINLISNAKKATCHPDISVRRIVLGVKLDRTCNQLQYFVKDNGIGIKSEVASQLFRHGFTKFKDGHGFGLHSGANAATEMNGSLTACSDGEGSGAKFTLTVPAVSPVVEGAHR